MMTRVRPRRSALYVPGNNPRAIEKARSLPADVVIFDLEDAVDDDAKSASRAAVCQAVASVEASAPQETVVRINGLGTEWHDADLAAAAHSGASAVLVPKIENGQQVQRLAAALVQANAPQHLQLWAILLVGYLLARFRVLGPHDKKVLSTVAFTVGLGAGFPGGSVS